MKTNAVTVNTVTKQQIEAVLSAHISDTPVSWEKIVELMRTLVPETNKKTFNWIIVRAIIQGMGNIKRTNDIRKEEYVQK